MRVEDVYLDEEVFVAPVIVDVPKKLRSGRIVLRGGPDLAQELGAKRDGYALVENQLATDDKAHSRLAVRGRGGQLSVIGPNLDLIPCSDRP